MDHDEEEALAGVISSFAVEPARSVVEQPRHGLLATAPAAHVRSGPAHVGAVYGRPTRFVREPRPRSDRRWTGLGLNFGVA
jgi:hypothetical protein